MRLNQIKRNKQKGEETEKTSQRYLFQMINKGETFLATLIQRGKGTENEVTIKN